MIVEQRHSLVVGNSSYDRQQLKYLPGAAIDAQSVAHKTEAQPGFENKVNFRVNLARRDLVLQLLKLKATIEAAADCFVLFYFAGHARVNSQGALFLVCTDYEAMEGNIDAALDQYGVSLCSVLDQVASATRALVIVDACRDNRGNAAAHDIDYSMSLGDALVVYSCEPGGFALDGCIDGQGYTEMLLKHLFDPTKSIFMGLEKSKQATKDATSGRQTPQQLVCSPQLYEGYYITRAYGGLDQAVSASSLQDHAELFVKIFNAKQAQKVQQKLLGQAQFRRQQFEAMLPSLLTERPNKTIVTHEGQVYKVQVSRRKTQMTQADFRNSLTDMCEDCKLKGENAISENRRTRAEIQVTHHGSSIDSEAEVPQTSARQAPKSSSKESHPRKRPRSADSDVTSA